MVEQNAGFRFDIYERVHLPEGTPAIRDLEEIELIPFVQGIPGQEQSRLRGNLRLTVVYQTDQEGNGKQTFTHHIPVEISLPVMSDDERNQEIHVQIDHFDVELLSQRSLNVTGVLSLTGWAQERRQAEEAQQAVEDANDEIFAEYQKDESLTGDLQPFGTEELSEMHELELDQDIEKEFAEENSRTEEQYHSVAEEKLAAEALEEVPEKEVLKEQHEPLQEAYHKTQPEIQPEGHPIADKSPVQKQEMKVAFKPQSSGTEDEATAANKSNPEKSNNALEWKKLFLTNEDKVQFKQMRICIVQKEETIQTIAERYQLQPREIALYNRLGETDVVEGQLIYIPGK